MAMINYPANPTDSPSGPSGCRWTMPVCDSDRHVWTEVTNRRGRALVVEGHAVYLCAHCDILKHSYRLICQSAHHVWVAMMDPLAKGRRLTLSDGNLAQRCLRCDMSRMVSAT